MAGPGPASAAAAQANPMPIRTDIAPVDKTISTYNGGETQKYRWSQQTLNVDM